MRRYLEWIIAAAIVILLAGIGVPAFFAARREAIRIQHQNNLLAFAVAIKN
jgi:type II secretory pathway pseudopilin PulG